MTLQTETPTTQRKRPKKRRETEQERVRREYWALADRWQGVLPWGERLELQAQMRDLAARDTELRGGK